MKKLLRNLIGTFFFLLLVSVSFAEASNGEADHSLLEIFDNWDPVAVRSAIESGASPLLRDERGVSVLHYATAHGNTDLIPWLISEGADVDSVDSEGVTPLQVAIIYENHTAVEVLLRAGADPFFKAAKGTTALHAAAGENNAPLIHRLLKDNSRADIQDSYGMTPLMWAAMKDGYESALVLLAHGASLSIEGNEGVTALSLAKDEYNYSLAELLESIRENKMSSANIRLLAASRVGDIPMLESALKEGVLINYLDNRVGTPLHLAARYGHIEIVNGLLKKGANRNLLDGNDSSPLFTAITSGNYGVVEILLASDSDISRSMANGLTPMHLLAQNGNGELFNKLWHKLSVEERSRLATVGETGEPLLNFATMGGNVEIVRLVLETGVDVNITNEGGETALDSAIQRDSDEIPREIVSLLLARGADPTIAKNWYGSAVDYAIENPENGLLDLLKSEAPELMASYLLNIDLQKAVRTGDTEKIASLIAEGADVNYHKGEEGSPLSLAFNETKDQDVVTLLIGKGADLDQAIGWNQASPLDAAFEKRWPAVVRLIVEKTDVDVNEVDEDGTTLLLRAVISEDSDMVKALLDLQAEINIEDAEGNTPLSQAVLQESPDAIVMLLAAGANPDFINKSGETALDKAFQFNRYDRLKLLLGAGADINGTGQQGRTWAHRAVVRREQSFLKEVLRAGGNPNISDSQGDTPLLTAVRHNDVDIARQLLKAGADPDLCSQDICPVNVAVAEKKVDMVKLLARHGANLFRANSSGETTLHLAAAAGSREMVDYLLKKGADASSRDSRSLLPFHHAYLNLHSELSRRLAAKVTFSAQEDSSAKLFGDPRIRYWSTLFLAGKAKKVMKLVEKDLLSPKPHPFAGQVWVAVHEAGGDLEEAYGKAKQNLKGKLGVLPKVELLTKVHRYNEAVEKFPPDYDFSSLDYWALIELAVCASNISRIDDRYRYLAKAARLHPDNFQAAWMAANSNHLLLPGVRKRMAELIAEPGIDGSLFAKFISLYLDRHKVRRTDEIQALSEWLKKESGDVRAMTSLGYSLASNFYLEKGLSAFQQAFVRYPFYSNWDEILENLLRLERSDDARRFALQVAEVLAVGKEKEGPENYALRKLAWAKKYSGDKGGARQLAEEGIAKWPGSGSWQRLMGTIEMEDNRYEQAIEHFRKAVLLESSWPANHTKLIEALQKAGEYQDARKAFLAARELVIVDLELFQLGLTVLEKLKDSEYLSEEKKLQLQQEDKALLEMVAAAFPESAEILQKKAGRLWDSGRREEAMEIMEGLVVWQLDDKNIVKQYASYLENSGSGEAPKSTLLDPLLEKYPWEVTLWNWKVEKLNNDDDIVEAWQEAARLNPGQIWPWEKELDIYVKQNELGKALQLLDTYETSPAVGTGTIYDMTRAILLRGWILEQMAKKGTADHGNLRGFLTKLEKWRSMYGSLASYYRYRESLLLSLGDKKAAALALWRRSRISMDETSIFHDLVAKYSSELSAAQTIGYGHRMLQRDPYSPLKNVNFLHKHVYWSGSNIVALKRIEEIKKLGIDLGSHQSRLSGFERKARAALGDTVSGFQGYAEGNSFPGGSDRYVSWFESARRKVLREERLQISYHFEDNQAEVEILQPNGELFVRRDHPVFGKVSYIGQGASYVALEYDAQGNLTEISTSAGKKITLTYNGENQIAQFSDSTGEGLEFTYNEAGKPVIIREQKGNGEVFVSYRPNGEIAKVHSPAGHGMALKVTGMFQKLLAQVRLVQQYNKTGRMPDIPFNDPELAKLRDGYEIKLGMGGEEAWQARLAFARYLVDHIRDNRDYFHEAREALDLLISVAMEPDASESLRRNGAEAVQLWHRVMSTVKPRGLPREDYAEWSRMVTWLRNQAYQGNDGVVTETLRAIDAKPLRLMRDAQWLYKSDFKNPGFWKRYDNQAIFAKGHAETAKQAVLLRRNGDLLVGTERGLYVLRKGHWLRYGFDRRLRRFNLNLEFGDTGLESSVLALAETEQGVLWIGTAKGLVSLDGEYDGPANRWTTKEDGLQSPRVEHLQASGEQIYVFTPAGVATVAPEGRPTGIFDNLHAVAVDGASHGNDDWLIVADRKGLWAINGQQKVLLNEKRFDSVAWMPEREMVYAVQGTSVFSLSWDGEKAGRLELLADKNDLSVSLQVYGLAKLPVPDAGDLLAVFTDQGIGLFRDGHFQFLDLPFAAQRAGLTIGPRKASASASGSSYYLASDGVYGFEYGKVYQDKGDRVYSMVTDSELGLTYIARGNRLEYMDHDDSPPEVNVFSRINARHLALDKEGRLLANDGTMIVRFERGSSSPQELFDARQGTEVESWQGPVRNILAAKNGTIWVAAGSSVFRWRDGEKEEFNYSINPESFPSRSEMISRVYETVNGQIMVVASDEKHLALNGVTLAGGVLQWQEEGNRFERIEGARTGWFVTGYTPIGEKTAIVGTNRGFYKDESGVDNAVPYRRNAIDSASYKNLKEEVPMLWLGRSGTRLGDDEAWLFPSAGGAVLYYRGKWLYPERLNQLLPKDQAYGQYGGRTVHAVASDAKGRVYVGSDLGLLIYTIDSIESLLIDEGEAHRVFADMESDRRDKLRDVIFSRIDENSEAGRLLKKLRELTSDDEGNELALPETSTAETATAMASSPEDRTDAGQLKENLKKRERARQRLLAKLEKEHYGLFQLLKLDPREVAAMKGDLQPGEALVQYLPTPGKLFINLTTRDGSLIKEVEVDGEELLGTTMEVVRYLRHGAAELEIGQHKEFRGKPLQLMDALSSEAWREQLPAMQKKLGWLYDVLLRPIEQDIADTEILFVSPVGFLTYLPFSALVRQVEPKVEYAVERFNMGIMPSMFHFNLILRQDAGYSEATLLIADPDGSLPGARQEVAEICKLLQGENNTLVGEEATVARLEGKISDARILHLATHGILDSEEPGESYLVMADGKRLGVVDIMMMDMDQTDLVVLSACESGIGPEGMEFATMARAFAHAKVPTVIASLWSVHDMATRKLMQHFYTKLEQNENFFASLAGAQRQMLKESGDATHPSAWSAFTVFGKP